MTNTHALRRYLAVLAAIALCTISVTAQPQNKVRIIQTNSAGDNVHVIDPATNKVVGVISGIEVNHGVGAAPDGSRIYISDEAESTLDVVDAEHVQGHQENPVERPPEQHRRRARTAGACMSRSSRRRAAST